MTDDLLARLHHLRETWRKRAKDLRKRGFENVGTFDRCADDLDAVLRSAQASSVLDPFLMPERIAKLGTYLDQLFINGDTIGDVRRELMFPWDDPWNGIVRDETAKREQPASPPTGSGQPKETNK